MICPRCKEEVKYNFPGGWWKSREQRKREAQGAKKQPPPKRCENCGLHRGHPVKKI